MKIHDVTAYVYSGMPVYPDDPETAVERVSSIAGGGPSNVSAMRICLHAGTHVDPPLHMLEGEAGADELPLDAMIGPALVVEAQGALDRGFLASAGLAGAERVLFKAKGRAGAAGKDEGCPYLDPDAAACLVELGVRLVGTGCMSIERPDSPGLEAHRRLLKGGVVVVEGLELSGVEPGGYELICLPMKIKGGDGAPARAVLIKAG